LNLAPNKYQLDSTDIIAKKRIQTNTKNILAKGRPAQPIPFDFRPQTTRVVGYMSFEGISVWMRRDYSLEGAIWKANEKAPVSE